MKRVFSAAAAAAAIALVFGGGAQAAPQCFWPAEVEADQAVRFQTELMLVAETCKDPSYNRFLERNGDALAAYQQILFERFEREQGNAAEAALERYMTRLANEASLRAGRTSSFCAEAADLVATANGLPPDNGLKIHAAAQAAAATGYTRCAAEPDKIVSASAATMPVVFAPPFPAASVAPVARTGTDEDGLLAALADSDAARALDPADRRQIKETTQWTLETVPSGQAISWRNPFSRNSGAVKVSRTFRGAQGRWCRDFEQAVTVYGETYRGHGTACRRPAGTWDIQP